MSSHSNVLTLIISFFSDDKRLGPLTYRPSISAVPKSCDFAGRGEDGVESPGYQSSATKNSLLVLSKLSVTRHVPFSLSRWAVPLLLAHVWWDVQSHPSREALMSQWQADSPELQISLPRRTAVLGKAMQENRGGFPAPASPLAHSGKAGSNQPFISPGLCLSSHERWMVIALTSQRGLGALFGNAYIMPWLKDSVEGNVLIIYYWSSKRVEGKGCWGERSGTSVGYKTILCHFAPACAGKAAVYRVIARQPGLTRKPQSKVMCWIVCSFSPFGWHFSTRMYVVSILLWALCLAETQAAGRGWVQPWAVGPGWQNWCVWHLEQGVLSWVTSTDTAMMQRSDGNHTVTHELEHLLLYVWGSFHRFHWVSSQLLLSACPSSPSGFQASYRWQPWAQPLGALPVPKPISVLLWRLPRSAVNSIRWD